MTTNKRFIEILSVSNIRNGIGYKDDDWQTNCWTKKAKVRYATYSSKPPVKGEYEPDKKIGESVSDYAEFNIMCGTTQHDYVVVWVVLRSIPGVGEICAYRKYDGDYILKPIDPSIESVIFANLN